MMRMLGTAILAAMLAGGLAATPLAGEKTYDLLFRGGTLDDIDRDAGLVYRREVTNVLKPDAAARDTGDVALSFQTGEAMTALLEFHQDGKHKPLGKFPASVGNPIIMFFYETVVRDMAESAGGSPFYIRNRVKEALVAPSELQEGEARFNGRTVPTQTVLIRPFLDDPNRDRMLGFGDLELRVTMSDAVPGWYLRLEAEAAGGDVYRSELTFERMDEEP